VLSRSLDRLGTLTYAGQGCHDAKQVRSDVAGFFKRLRSITGGGSFPYVWVPEWHPKGHGLHLHYAMGRYVRRGLIDEAWGHGFVGIKRLSDLPVGASGLKAGRASARYLSKYVTKDFVGGAHVPGLHRYEVAEGFQPAHRRFSGNSAEEVIAKAVAVMGGQPSARWTSNESVGWEGPPALWFSWDQALAAAGGGVK